MACLGRGKSKAAYSSDPSESELDASESTESPHLTKMGASKILSNFNNEIISERKRTSSVATPTLRLDEAINHVTVMASFRKYLHDIHANEVFSFWLEAELYSMVPLSQREKRSQEIFHKYFDESSEYYLYVDNFDVEDLKKKALYNPQKDTFSDVQEQLWAILSMQCWAGYKKSKFFQMIVDCTPSISFYTSILTLRVASSEEDGVETRKKRAGTMDKLAEFLSKRATMDIVEDYELTYSDVFFNKELCAGFASYLESVKLVDSLLLSFEIEIYRLSNEGSLTPRAVSLYQKYIAPNPSLVPEMVNRAAFEKEVQEAPTKTTFQDVTNYIFRTLNLKHFPAFISSADLSSHMEAIAFSDNVRAALNLYDTLAGLKQATTAFKQNEIKASRKVLEVKIRTKTITIADLLFQRDITLAFREYLYSIYADSLFSFLISAELYKHSQEHKRKVMAPIIYAKYIDPESEDALDFDADKIDSAAMKQGVSTADPELFASVMETVTSVVREQFLPNFLRSQHYQKVVAANGIPLIKRRSTLQHLEDLYKSLMEKEERALISPRASSPDMYAH